MLIFMMLAEGNLFYEPTFLLWIVLLIISVPIVILFGYIAIEALKEYKEQKKELKRDIAEELKKLAALREQGLLTDEEFFELKKKLLR